MADRFYIDIIGDWDYWTLKKVVLPEEFESEKVF
jgi:hypothetical protein